MKSFVHKGSELHVHFPGHVMVGYLSEVGFDNLIGFIGQLEEKEDGKSDLDPVELAKHVSTMLFWGLKGGQAFNDGKMKGNHLSLEQVQDIIWDDVISKGGTITALTIESLMEAWPQAEGSEEKEDQGKEKPKGKKKK